MRRRRRSLKRRGFSLLEMLIAIFLLSIIIAILGQLFPFSKNALRHSESVSIAIFLAQQVMEENMVRPEAERSREGTFQEPFEEYRYKLTQTPFSGGGADLVRMRVDVTRHERRLFFVETVIFR
ncbi:MAG: type II secretion system protein [Armatimonadetes bacterium]|nr:type II secretion system protein [Armatimonadota bacterium]